MEPALDQMGMRSVSSSQQFSPAHIGHQLQRAYRQLRATFATWDQVRDAPMDDVVEAIRSAGSRNRRRTASSRFCAS